MKKIIEMITTTLGLAFGVVKKWYYKLRPILLVVSVLALLISAYRTITYINSERAIVIIADMKVDPNPLVPFSEITVTTTLRNIGKVPAYVLNTATSLHISSNGLPKKPEYKTQDKLPKAAIGPNDTVSLISTYNPEPHTQIPEEFIKRVESKKATMYYFGKVKYRDVMGLSFLPFQNRILSFCLIYDHGTKPIKRCGNSLYESE